VSLRALAARALPPRLLHAYRMLRHVTLAPFEPELPFVGRWLDRDRVAVDVGANVGVYADILTRGSSRVIAFEPNRACVEHLRRLALPRVEIVEAAVSDAAGEAQLRVPRLGGGANAALGSIAAANALDSADTVESYAVPTVTLDDALDARLGPGERVGFVKIDVEGHEAAVLVGAHRLVERDRPVVLVETEARHGGEPERVFALLEQAGYRGFCVVGDGLAPISAREIATRQTPDRAAAKLAGRRNSGYVNNVFFVPEPAGR
jgi:FkbM family methyltransferase